jgi:hypothetical protein
LSKMFRDPFYYGILVQAKQTVDLRELYEFTAAVTEDDWNAVQQLSNRRFAPASKKRMTFYPLRNMVFCAYCNSVMYPAPGTGYKRYLYYRCDNKQCTRQKRSIRAKVIFERLYKELADGLNFTEREYKQYLDRMQQLSGTRRIEIETKIRSLHGSIKANNRDIQERGLRIVNYDKGSPVWEVNNNKINELTDLNLSLENEIEKLKLKLRDPAQELLSVEQFLNLSKNASAKLKAADEVGKDKICRWIFLNFVVDDEKVASYSLKEPFATLLKQRQIHTGGRERT